jgi:hypothetical protein
MYTDTLKIKIRTAVWFAINDTIHLTGTREEKMWNESDPRDRELMKVLDTKTVELSDRIMNIIDEQLNKPVEKGYKEY